MSAGDWSGSRAAFCAATGAEVPLICGAMYPCSNPELVGAVARAGAMAIVQPLSLVYVHGRDFREGIREIATLAEGRPSASTRSSRSPRRPANRMRQWIDVALEEGVHFFVTALGNPSWVVEKARGGQPCTTTSPRGAGPRRRDVGVDGLICVNSRAGGHAGTLTPEQLMEELGDLELPLVAAGGAGDEEEYARLLSLGYGAVQMGTRFIATEECKVHEDYWTAILEAEEDDIVLTERLSGVPVAVINTPLVQKVGTKAGPIARRLLKGRRTKHWMRTFYALRSLRELKKTIQKGVTYKDVWQAGRSVGGIRAVEPAGDVVARFAAAARRLEG